MWAFLPAVVTFFWFIVALGILIFIHEMGHFLVAKFYKVRVEKFSLGFGPKIWGFTHGETEYVISWIPFGGYVKMLGEGLDEEEESPVEVKDDPNSFAAKPVGQRMQIVLAGPIMNLVLALMIMPVVFMLGIERPQYLHEKPVIGWTLDNSPARNVGLIPGDRIAAIDGQEMNTWEKVQQTVISQPGHGAVLRVESAKGVREVAVVFEQGDNGGGYLGALPPTPAVLGGLAPGYPAEKHGLKVGDKIVSIDGNSIDSWFQMAEVIHGQPEVDLKIEILRGEEVLTYDITTVKDAASGVGLIGISEQIAEMYTERYGFFESISKGTQRNVELFVLTFDVILKLVTGQISPKTLGGPIMIAQVAGSAARSGLADFLQLLAFISMQLGVLNLLPIPVLDGGHFFFQVIEVIRRKPVSLQIRMIAQQFGFVVLLGLMVLVTYQDIMRTWGGFFQKFFG